MSTTTSKISLLLLCCLLPLPAAPAEYRARVGDFSRVLTLSGSLQARKGERFVVPQANTWRIQIKWMVEEGQVVKPGDPVVRLDTANMDREIQEKELSLESKEEQREQKLSERGLKEMELQIQVRQTEIEYKKAQLDAAIPKDITSAYEYEKKQLELERKRQAWQNARLEQRLSLAAMAAEIKKIDLEIEEDRAGLVKLRGILDKMTLKAGGPGAVMYAMHPWEGRKLKVDDNVSPNWTVATIPDNESLQVEAWINETEINRVEPGRRVELILDAYPQRRFGGVVKEVANSAEKRKMWGKAHYFQVNVELDERDPAVMKPGMSVACLVRERQVEGVVLVPLEAAYFDGRDFYLQKKGSDAVRIEPLGFNEFDLALPKEGPIEPGAVLVPIEGIVR